MVLMLSANFFSKLTFQNSLSGTLSECHLNSLDPDQDRQFSLSVLIWVQTVCKGYQQTTKVAASNKESVKYFSAKTYEILVLHIIWQRRLGRDCAYEQSHQSLYCRHTQSMVVDEDPDK